MKKLSFLLTVMICLLGTFSVFAHGDKTEKFHVGGNCEMCKKTIEKAARVKGVEKAVWDVDTKELTLTYNPEETTIEKVQKSVAAAGYDAGIQKADDAAYNKLPSCCKYERGDNKQEPAHQHQHQH